ncbi:hypothetical protein NLG97_g3509 [Lecanicillium saksenae]|uniref:Uncharacterized protein n=1 Tax=Lecanicillium saksenae TaxID=468837 RepID=A0ACC1QZS5_9HYPO|nr:hypothetical protein NLG97_g3509 [Lecanicillium saksenae]
MMLHLPLFFLFFGASMASQIQVRQDDLSARVKALEDFLAKADSSCVEDCAAMEDSCEAKGPKAVSQNDVGQDRERKVPEVVSP